MLCDATGFTRGDFGAADVIEQRGFAVIDVTHDRDHRSAGDRLGLQTRGFFFGESFGVVQRGDDSFVTHFFHHDHGGVLVQGLVDGGHLTQLHQLFDDLGGFDGHLVGQLGHGDGFRHMHFDDACFRRCALHRGVIPIPIPAATGATTPAVATHTPAGVATGFDFFFLGLFIGPAGRQLGALDFFLTVFGDRATSWTCTGCGAASSRFVQGALDGFGVHRGFFRLWFFRDQDFLGRIHHGANGFGFGQRGATAAVQIFGACSIFFSAELGSGFALSGFSLGLRQLRGSGLSVFVGGGHGFGGQDFAVFGLLGFAQAAFFRQLFFLAANELSLATRFFFATRQFGLIQDGLNGRGVLCSLSRGFGFHLVVAFDEGAFLAHFHLDGAGFARGIGLFDLRGGFLHQGDFFALWRVCAMAGFQKAQQFLLVGIRQLVCDRALGDARRLQLLKQCVGRFFEFLGKLGNRCDGHLWCSSS